MYSERVGIKNTQEFSTTAEHLMNTNALLVNEYNKITNQYFRSSREKCDETGKLRH